jgi:hypothetical protein
MGFWHTGYEEHHQISSFWDSGQTLDLSVEYKCEQCGRTFQSVDFLVEHRFSAHPYKSPILFIRERQLGSLPININTPLNLEDISIGCASSAILNGKKMSLDELKQHLSKVRQENIDLILSNSELSLRYRINFNISSEEDLSGVESEFLRLVESKELTRSSIDRFILKAAPYKSATNYIDGLCEYFYGVLAKEGAESSSLLQSKYREKFNRSAGQLMDYSRPLANFVKGLIAFHFNHFLEARKFLNDGNLFKISGFYEQIFMGNDVEIKACESLATKFLENTLVDYETNLILNVFKNVDLSRVDLSNLDQEGQSDKLSEFGKIKIKILMIKLYIKSKNEKKAVPILKDLKGLSNLEPWVNKISKKIE